MLIFTSPKAGISLYYTRAPSVESKNLTSLTFTMHILNNTLLNQSLSLWRALSHTTPYFKSTCHSMLNEHLTLQFSGQDILLIFKQFFSLGKTETLAGSSTSRQIITNILATLGISLLSLCLLHLFHLREFLETNMFPQKISGLTNQNHPTSKNYQ